MEHTITKRQTNTDEKSDLFFCNIVLANDYFSIELDAKLEYIYYEQGGWILENISFQNKIVTPKEPNYQMIYDHFMTQYRNTARSVGNKTYYTFDAVNNSLCSFEQGKVQYFYLFNDNIKLVSTFFDDKNGSYIAGVDLEVIAGLSTNIVRFSLNFDESKGWVTYDNPTISSQDLSVISVEYGDYIKAAGRFKCRTFSGDVVEYEIKINTDNEKTTYQILYGDYDGQKMHLGSKGEFNPIECSIYDIYTLYYDAISDKWYRMGTGEVYTRVG